MHNKEVIALSREVTVRMVPSGAEIQLPKYTEVMITQDLGDSFTVNVYGNLARIEGKDADALGKEVVDALADIDYDTMSMEDIVMSQLKTVFDPEIPINIVDLGLVYHTHVIPLGKDEYHIKIDMTLTAPGCGMGPVIADDVKYKLERIKGVVKVDVEMVFDPPWDRSMMSQAAHLQLGMF